MTRTYHMTLGDLISTMYEEFLDIYADSELASVAVAAVINDLLAQDEVEEEIQVMAA